MKRLLTFAIIALATLPVTAAAQVTLTNPLGETDPRLLIARFIQGVLSITGSIALLMVIYGGLVWMFSQGKPESIQKGKAILVWAILGIIVIASAYVLTNAVFQAVLTGDVAG